MTGKTKNYFTLLCHWEIRNGTKTYDSLKINPVSINGLLLYLLKSSENIRFSVFRGYRSETLVENGLSSSL